MMRLNSNDISFSLLGFQTTIQPFFWPVAALLTAVHIGNINNNMPLWIAYLITGMAGVLLSLMVHELGHALTFRHLLHTNCMIVLHGFGGMTVPLQHRQRKYSFFGAAAECFLAFSGPLAGFILALLAIILLYVVPENAVLVIFFLKWTAVISIFWGIFNLLPIYPMDGGHISREVFLFFSPWRGVEYSLILSMTLAVLLAIAAVFLLGEIFIACFFAFFAYQNYQELSFRSFR